MKFWILLVLPIVLTLLAVVVMAVHIIGIIVHYWSTPITMVPLGAYSQIFMAFVLVPLCLTIYIRK